MSPRRLTRACPFRFNKLQFRRNLCCGEPDEFETRPAKDAGQNRKGLHLRIIIASSLVFTSLSFATEAAAQWSLPPGYVSDGTGVHVNADLTQAEWDELVKAMGDDFAGGYYTNEELCEAAIDAHANALEEILVGVAGFVTNLFSCESPLQSTVDDILLDLEDMCYEQDGLTLVMLDRAGCEIPAFRQITCEFEAPDIKPTCDGLRELCEDTNAFGEITPPTATEPGHVQGYYEVPGCTCEVSYVIGEPICEEPTGRVRVSLPQL